MLLAVAARLNCPQNRRHVGPTQPHGECLAKEFVADIKQRGSDAGRPGCLGDNAIILQHVCNGGLHRKITTGC